VLASLVLVAILGFTSLAAAQATDCSLVPGWQQQGPSRAFEADNLFEYMDGNAEGYLVYQFVNMKGVTCQCAGDALLIDISEMADPEYAYGIFMANRDVRHPIERIGMGGQILPRRATFAKGKYYVEIGANPEKDHTLALRAFVAGLEKQIEGQSTPPEAVAWFPAKGLVPDSVRLVPESVLGLRVLKRGYVGQYDFGKGFLVSETSPEAAAQVMAKLRERIGQTTPTKVADEAFNGTDKYLDGVCIFRKGRVLAGFANLKPGHEVLGEATSFAAQIQ
jgi:Family of unknown function (DUF6599)